MSEMIEVPKGWIKVYLSDIGQIVSGGTPSTTISEYWNNEVNWISPADLSGYKKKVISKGAKSISRIGLLKSSAKLIPAGSVLFSSRAPIGYVAIAGSELCTNQGFKSVVPYRGIFNEYLYYFLLSAKQQADDLASGTTFREISLSSIRKMTLLLPPSPEQYRIVAKIEELFSSLDKGIEILKTAQAQLKIYRQAVLKWAFEGKLTNDDVKEGELPKGWITKRLSEISEKVQIGPFGSQLHKEDYIENGVPLINPMHIKDGKIIPDYSYSILEKKKNSLPNYILHTGDIVLGRRGEMGRCGLVSQKENGWFCGTGSLYIRPIKTKIDSKYLYMILCSTEVKKYLQENAAGTTMSNLNSKIINQMPLSFPPLSEQQSIVSEIESRLSVCDKLEESINQSLMQAEALRQSILKKAFEGKLVPQDPNDESASVLLERIRAEREAAVAKNATAEAMKPGRRTRTH